VAGLKGLTVNTAPEAEPQIYAEDDAAVFQTMFGEDGVSSIGQACKATVLSNNKVRVADGVICVGGHFARIPYGEYEDCEITNGQSGKNRNDIIVARFETTGTGGIDTYTCEVKQGTPGDAATDPELTQDNLYNGGKVRELPLYRVKIEGISIVAVEQMFDVVPTNAELIKTVAELNGKINNRKNNVLIGKWGSSWSLSTTAKNIGSSKPIVDDDCYKTTTGANATVTIKQSGLYCVTMYAQGAANQGASACIQAQVIADRTIIDDNYVLFGSQYSYNSFSANVNMSRIIYLESGTVLSPQIKKSDTSGASATTGSSYMEVVKLA
jgi:hypothetical protein